MTLVSSQSKSPPTSPLRALAAYSGAALLCLIVVGWVMRLWDADLSIPFDYLSCCGDAFFHGLLVKGVIDNGWHLENPWVGMPTGLHLYDFPRTEYLHLLLIKLLSLFSHNYAIVLNLYFLLTFPLTTLVSLYVFRQFGLSYPPALVASLLFTFLPYHFLRGENHLFMASYYLIPLMVMVIVQFTLGHSWRPGDPHSQHPSTWRRPTGAPLLITVVVCVIVAFSGLYEAFFACFFLLMAGIAAALASKRVAPLLIAGLLIALTTTTFLITLAPTFVYRHRNGANPEVTRRPAEDAERYGLKITQMLLPVSGHRIAGLAALKERYNHRAPLVNENDFASLGIVGSAGFLLLIGRIFYQHPTPSSSARQQLLVALSLFTLIAVLLATIGGFSSLFALLISPQIRGYNRISVYVAFFALFGVAIWLEHFVKRAASRIGRLARYGMVGALLPLGLLDQTTPGFVPPYAALQTEYTSDAAFVRQIESLVPAQAMIFQLPYMPFPESPPVDTLLDSGLFRGYLHSTQLRWSYGAMRGREGDLWQRELAAKPMDQFVETLAFAGFSGIYLDRYGYRDRGAAAEVALSGLLGNGPIITSANRRLVFFGLTEYAQKLRARYTLAAWEARREWAQHPVLPQWVGGFSGLEGTAEKSWRWCATQGELILHNTSHQARQVRLEMSFSTGYEEVTTLQINSPWFSNRLTIDQASQPFSTTLTVHPGQHRIRFTSTAKPVHAPNDSRILVFRVMNFRLHEIAQSRT